MNRLRSPFQNPPNRTRSTMKAHSTRAPRAIPHSASSPRPSALLGRRARSVCCGLVFACAVAVHGAPPELMTYQGFLVDGNGNPLASTTPANYGVIFRIFPVSTGGQSLWAERQIVTVDKGNFSVLLGDGVSVANEPRGNLSALFAGNGSEERYMSLSVEIGNTTSEMLPRLRLLPSPYAYLAGGANALIDPSGNKLINAAANGLQVVGAVTATGGLTLGGALSAASLDVTGVSSFSSPLSIKPQGGNEGGEILLQSAGASNPEWRFDTALNQIRFHSGGVVKFSVDTLGNASISGNGLVAGNLGLGTPTPGARLEVNGGVKVDGNNSLEFGAGIPGKQFDAGRVGYQIFTPDALDVVGAGTTGGNRKIRFWTEGGADFTGNINANGAIRARGGAPGPGGSFNNGFAFAGNGGDNDSGMFSSADGQIEFYGNAAERMRINASGFVGIGTTTPGARLEVNGGVRVLGNNTLEFGADVAGKEASAGKIGYQTYTGDALDIVGAGTAAGVNTRRVHIWAEGGTTFQGSSSQGITILNGNLYFKMYRNSDGLVLEENSPRNANNIPSQGLGRAIWDGDGNLDSYSDRRLKKDIAPAESLLERVIQLPVHRFHWNHQEADAPKIFGVVAQEVQPLFPEIVRTVSGPDDGERMMTVKYGAFGLIAVKALQEVKAEKDAEIAALKEEVGALRQQVASLRDRQLDRTAEVDTLRRELDGLKQTVRQLAAASNPATSATLAALESRPAITAPSDAIVAR